MLADRWQRVEELFHVALECGPESRAALLESECSGDPIYAPKLNSCLRTKRARAVFSNRPLWMFRAPASLR
jgi:hypothetical protein